MVGFSLEVGKAWLEEEKVNREVVICWEVYIGVIRLRSFIGIEELDLVLC